MYITVYHAYIAPHIAYTYHSAGLLYHIQARICTSAYAVYTHSRRSADGDMPGKAPKKCGYRRTRYAPYMVYFPHPTTQKHKKNHSITFCYEGTPKRIEENFRKYLTTARRRAILYVSAGQTVRRTKKDHRTG